MILWMIEMKWNDWNVDGQMIFKNQAISWNTLNILWCNLHKEALINSI